MTGPALPPRPEVDTGEPHPPRAPAIAGPWAGHRQRSRTTASSRPARALNWFDSPDPVLEMATARRHRGLRRVALWSVLSAAGLGGAFWLLVTRSSAPVERSDVIAAFAIGGGAWLFTTGGMYLIWRTQTIYAGAAWVGDGEDRADWVATYRLSRIRIIDAPGPGALLQITGSQPYVRTLQFPLGLVEGNPALWDLLYNGLVHSVAAGAAVDPITRQLLGLPGAEFS